jgi:hypothetical protein
VTVPAGTRYYLLGQRTRYRLWRPENGEGSPDADPGAPAVDRSEVPFGIPAVAVAEAPGGVVAIEDNRLQRAAHAVLRLASARGARCFDVLAKSRIRIALITRWDRPRCGGGGTRTIPFPR